MYQMYELSSTFLCGLKRRHTGITFVGVCSVVGVGFPCPEHNFVTVGPNHSNWYAYFYALSGDICFNKTKFLISEKLSKIHFLLQSSKM